MSLKTRTVYIISSALTPKVYIGSTSRLLRERFACHKVIKQTTNSNLITCYSDAKISPLCIIENCSKKEILLKEKDYMNAMKDIIVNYKGTLNSGASTYKAPGLLNGNEAKYKAIKYNCDCGGKYNNGNKAKHFKTKKHLNFSNIII
jgi:hypothetical protein